MKASLRRLMSTVHFLLAAAVIAASVNTRAFAGDPSGYSDASQLSVDGSATVLQGSVAGVTGTSEFVVTSAKAVGDGLVIVLRGVGRAGEVVLRVPKAMAGGVSVAVGETVTLAANGSGWLVKNAGKVIGFIPNESGRALLHSERVRQEKDERKAAKARKAPRESQDQT
jgi:hypothetical protein